MLLDQPRLLLRAEGLAILAGAAVLYAEGDYSWLLFAILFLAPDLSFAAWAAGPRIGAAGYNVLHNLVLPIGLATYGVVDNSRNATAVGLIWLAHRHRPHARLRAQVSDDVQGHAPAARLRPHSFEGLSGRTAGRYRNYPPPPPSCGAAGIPAKLHSRTKGPAFELAFFASGDKRCRLKEKGPAGAGPFRTSFPEEGPYIIPPMSGMPAGAGFSPAARRRLPRS